MRRWIARGIITGLLFVTATYLFRGSWSNMVFVFKNFADIIAGEIPVPEVSEKTIICLFAVPMLLGMLVGTIPRKDNTYIDEEQENK